MNAAGRDIAAPPEGDGGGVKPN